MKIAVLSDIHGNLEAFEAVTEDLAGAAPDMVICLGDLVGYGPDPEAVVTRVVNLGFVSVLGNHEAALFSGRAREWMNFQARENSIATKRLLTAASLEYCSALPRAYRTESALFVHGAPPESVYIYLHLLKMRHIARIFAENAESLFFVGHTHQLKLVSLEGGEVVREALAAGTCAQLRRDRKYLINCGSVGQPRDGDNRAKYILWDQAHSQVEVRAVRYDAAATAKKILARGFPQAYADRLG